MNLAMDALARFASESFEKYAKKDQFVYHLKSKSFQGDIIYPLSTLEKEKPSVYKQQMKKYEGREKQPLTKVPPLDCLWRDCINLSSLNPLLIFQIEELLGIPGYKRGEDVEILKFNIRELEGMDFCTFDENMSEKNKEAYKKMKPGSYKETKFVPHQTATYFAKCAKDGELPLLFAGVEHVLLKGELNIKDAEIITFKATIKL